MVALTDALTGAWSLLAAYVAAPDGSRRDLYGPSPAGSLVVAGGRLSALLTAGQHAVEVEADASSRALLAYTGRVKVDAGTFVTRVDAASIPAWVGTEQTRHYVIDGDRLMIRTPSGPHPAFPGGDVVGMLEWQREG